MADSFQEISRSQEPENSSKLDKVQLAVKVTIKQSSLITPQKIVYIKVGKEKTVFGVHKDFLCSQSRYFKAVFEGNFMEATTGELHLEATEPLTFGLFVDWLYTKNIDESSFQFQNSEITQKTEANHLKYKELVDLWLFAEYVQVPELQNLIADRIHSKYYNSCKIPTAAIICACNGTTDGSPLRKLFIDIIVNQSMKAKELLKILEDLPREVLIDMYLSRRVEKLKTLSGIRMLKSTHYHVSKRGTAKICKV